MGNVREMHHLQGFFLRIEVNIELLWYWETKIKSMVVGWYFHESYAKINDNIVPVDTPWNRCIAYIQIKWYTKLYVHGYWEIFIDMTVIIIAIETPKIYTMVLWIANEQVKSGLSGKRLIKMLCAWQSCILWKLVV